MRTQPWMLQLERVSHLLAKLPMLWYSRTLLIILLIFVSQQLAQLTWTLVPFSPIESERLSTTGDGADSGSHGLNISQLLGLHLFGKVAEKDDGEIDITNAPVTQLNLYLTGALASSNEKLSIAIIANGSGPQNSYSIGDYVSETQARIRQIFSDRVILTLNGQNQTLLLDGADLNDAVTSLKKRGSSQPAAHRLTSEMRKRLMNEPELLGKYIQIQPWVQNGEIVGYRVAPGVDNALMQQLGLQKDDIVESINGFQLNDPSQATQIMGELDSLQSLNVTVNRNGQQQQLEIKLGE